jgi:cyclopropane-fatty-acyl-phospholipid synthase
LYYISKKQFEYAKERIHNCGLNEKVNIEIKDYRDLKVNIILLHQLK